MTPVCKHFGEPEAELLSGPLVQLWLFAVLQVLASGKIYIVDGNDSVIFLNHIYYFSDSEANMHLAKK